MKLYRARWSTLQSEPCLSPEPQTMAKATATYEILSSTEAYIEVTYADGRVGVERVVKPRYGSLYETVYNTAANKAAFQGQRLERFTKV